MRLSEDEARARFAAARVARLATVDAAGVPHLVPVTFAFERGAIVFAVDHKPKRGTDLRRLRNIAANPSVAFLADAYDEDWTRLWWVRADGYAAVVPGHPVDALVAKYPQYRERLPEGPVVRTEITKISGWAAA